MVIDVIRAFTVSAYALAGGAAECRLVGGVEEARALAATLAGALISAEVEGLPVEGIAIACSLAVASATARAIRAAAPELVTLVATGSDRGHPEDRACAVYLEHVLRGETPDVAELLAPLHRTDRYRELAEGHWPGFPATDLDLCLAADRFDFAMPVERDALGLRLTALPT